MPLSWNEIRHRAIAFSKEWKGETCEAAERQSFWNDFFNVFGVRHVAFIPGCTYHTLNSEDPANHEAAQIMCDLHDALEAAIPATNSIVFLPKGFITSTLPAVNQTAYV